MASQNAGSGSTNNDKEMPTAPASILSTLSSSSSATPVITITPPASSSASVPSSSVASTSTPSSSPSPSLSAASAMETDTPSSSSSSLDLSLNQIVSNRKVADSSLRQIVKILAALKKAPSSLANRKMRIDNIALKKFIMDVTGAVNVLFHAGFKLVDLAAGGPVASDKKVTYLLIEEKEVNTQILTETIEKVEAKLALLEKKADPVVANKPRKICSGGCGFFGDESTEGYCSVCFKKKLAQGITPFPAPSPAMTPLTGPSAASATPSSLSLGASSTAQEQKSQEMCLKKCGNPSEPQYHGLCKNCWDKQPTEPVKRWKCCMDGAIRKLRAVYLFNKGKRPVQENKTRCWKCNKKVGILGIECRCRYIFCGPHRYMEAHDCPYDIKSQHRRKLRKENEEIKAAKLDKL